MLIEPEPNLLAFCYGTRYDRINLMVQIHFTSFMLRQNRFCTCIVALGRMVQIHVGKLILRHLDYGKTGFVVFVPGPCLETEKSVVPSPFSASNVRTTKISV